MKKFIVLDAVSCREQAGILLNGENPRVGGSIRSPAASRFMKFQLSAFYSGATMYTFALSRHKPVPIARINVGEPIHHDVYCKAHSSAGNISRQEAGHSIATTKKVRSID